MKIGRGAIQQISATLAQNNVSGKILYCADPLVDKLYGSLVRSQIKEIGRLKEESCDYNTISYAMNIAERVISTDIDCIVGLGAGSFSSKCRRHVFR